MSNFEHELQALLAAGQDLFARIAERAVRDQEEQDTLDNLRVELENVEAIKNSLARRVAELRFENERLLRENAELQRQVEFLRDLPKVAGTKHPPYRCDPNVRWVVIPSNSADSSLRALAADTLCAVIR